MAVAALVLGILGTLCSLSVMGIIPGALLSIVALILGILGRKQAVAESRPTGMATAGLVLGIVGLAISVLLFAACASCMHGMNKLGKTMELEAQKQEHDSLVKAAAQPPAPLGTPVSFTDDSTWTVSAAKDLGPALKAGAQAATTKGRFVQVRFAITNLTKKQDSILDLPAVVDDQLRELKPYDRSAAFIPADGHDLALAPLPPSIEKEFVEIYELPADAKGLKLRVRALAPFGDTRLVDLGL